MEVGTQHPRRAVRKNPPLIANMEETKVMWGSLHVDLALQIFEPRRRPTMLNSTLDNTLPPICAQQFMPQKQS